MHFLRPILQLSICLIWLLTTATTTGTFADDTVILATHEDPVAVARRLQSHLDHLETWLKKWRIIINETKP
jgi:hypothetical protein